MAKWVKFRLDGRVKVKLTPMGVGIMVDWAHRNAISETAALCYDREHFPDKRGWSEFTMRELLDIYGARLPDGQFYEVAKVEVAG